MSAQVGLLCFPLSREYAESKLNWKTLHSYLVYMEPSEPDRQLRINQS